MCVIYVCVCDVSYLTMIYIYVYVNFEFTEDPELVPSDYPEGNVTRL